MTTIAVLPAAYVPWKGYFDHLQQADICFLEPASTDTLIKTPDGLQRLVIPAENFQVKDFTWAAEHWEALEQNYARAPRFRDYAYIIYSLYQQMSEKSLSRINYIFIQTICDIFDIPTRFFLLESPENHLLQICQQVGATHFLADPASPCNPQLFAEAGITVRLMDFSGYPEYNQLYPPFQHQVSILDLLLTEGMDSARYLKLSW